MDKKFKVALLLNNDMAHRIFQSDDLVFLRSFAEIQDIDTLPIKVDEAFMKEAIKGADACITCWGTPLLTETVLDQAPDLKLIAHAAGSVRAIVTDKVWQRNIRVTSAAPIIAIDVAETVLGLIIISLKHIWQFNVLTHSGMWADDEIVDNEINCMKRLYQGVSVGIIGASHVGRNLIKLLKSFDVELLLYDPYVTEQQAKDIGAIKTSLDELIAKSDVVTLHAPNIPETHHMINRNNLALLKNGAIFINTARGAIVDEKALIDELKTGRIFACLDVTDPEPPSKDNPLRYMDNVILTPHIAGGHTINGRHQQGHYIIREVYNCLLNGRLQYEVKEDMMSIIA